MKTKQEIKNMRNLYKEVIASGCKITNDNKSKQTKTAMEENKRIIKILDWVLEDSEPKRTIFDLTAKELKELFFTAMPSTQGTNAEFWYYLTSKEHGTIEFELHFDNGENWKIYIYSDLSMYPYFEAEHSIEKQADYIDKIREMLSKSKEEIN